MASPPPFSRCVFINCPFDLEYRKLFRALIFTVVALRLEPRFALERADSGEQRNLKILQLIGESQFGIHDLSRCRATRKGEFYRMNMPLELGYDIGIKHKGGRVYSRKRILILEDQPHSIQRSASDLAGCDCEAHNGDPRKLVVSVRTWLVNEAGAPKIAPTALWFAYQQFNGWLDKELPKKGWSRADIDEIDLNELRELMKKWIQRRPLREI